MKEKILITVNTYPTLSRKYAELVCTAGVNESGEWRRIYPVRFRQLLDDQKYRKFQWIEAEIEKSYIDRRPESYQIVREESLRILGKPLTTAGKWFARHEVFLNKVPVHDDLTAIIQAAHQNELSLAVFKPFEWMEFTHEPVEREWDAKKLANLEVQRRQLDFFKDETTLAEELKVVKKLPYKFSYRFKDIQGKESKLMIEDWEIGALYWNCLHSSQGDEAEAVCKVKTKYWNEFVVSKRFSPALILGTTLEHHNKKASNPFVIVSVLAPPLDLQQRLF
ncbi:MAG: hypothetical protein JRC93_04305 [Deltaproteobacteria bacterium]|nr:hypothetical protein [Deltaproteobacteria bacterium]